MYDVKVKKTGDSKVLLEITVAGDTVSDEFERCYGQIKKETDIPGFRKGKAPMDLIRGRFKNKVNEEVLRNLVSEYYINALREKQITPVEHPKFNVKKFAEGSELTFTAEFEIKPEVNIANYQGLKVNKKPVEIKSEEIDKALEYLRQRQAEFSPILEVRPVQEGDFLTVDYSCYVESKLVDKKENVLLSTKDTAFPKEFIEQLSGAKTGEERQIKVKLPAKFADNRLAGKQAEFSVKINEIKKKILPSVDNEFAKDLGFDSLDKLKKVVNEDLKRQKENQSKLDMQEQIIEQLLKKTNVEIPENMLKQQAAALVQDAKNRFGRQPGAQKDDPLDDKSLNERLKPEAEKQLKIFFILDKIAEQENINVSDEEIDDRINILAAQTNQAATELKERLEKKGAMPQLKGQIRDEKTLDFLIKQAVVK